MPQPENRSDPFWASAWPPEMRKVEAERLAQRRKTLGLPAVSSDEVGFALSGGGIRAATFCLGIFQALAAQRLVRRVDYLSTVSGGGYFGGFLGRLISRGPAPAGGIDALLLPGRGESRVGAAAAPDTINPLKWLKQNGNYMAPGGGGDLLTLIATATRNFVALHLVVASTWLLLFLLLKLLLAGVPHLPVIGTFLAGQASLSLDLQDALGGGWQVSASLDLLPLLLILLVPPGWAYWLIEGPVRGELAPLTGFRWLIATLLWLLVMLLLAGWSGFPVPPPLQLSLCMITGMALLTDLCHHFALRQKESPKPDETCAEQPARDCLQPDSGSLLRLAAARSRLTSVLRGLMVAAVVICVIALIDSLGLSLHRAATSTDAGWFGALIVVLAPLALRFASLKSLVGKVMDKPGSRLKLPLQVITGLIGVAAWAVMLIAISWASHALATDPDGGIDTLAMIVSLVGLLVLCGLIGHSWVFLNRSSHASTYSARLTRAFLGASNPARFNAMARPSITDALEEDDSNMRDYHDKLDAHGGPLHFINVTINQTAAFKGQSVDRNRKGIGMAVGPRSLSAGVGHHALLPPSLGPKTAIEWRVEIEPLWNSRPYSMFAHPDAKAGEPHRVRVERLTLGQWVGISGAAFSTGLGSQTSLGLSLLLGFANVRLGHWWDSGRAVRYPLGRVLRKLIPVQAHLFDEVTARFHGPYERRWYLSDGGHFENMGAYELIRRRLPLIVVVDGEEDANYTYEGFANLVRKARLDFKAEIAVIGDMPADPNAPPSVFGTLDQLAPAKAGPDAGFSPRRAVLAEVRYDGADAPGSLLVYLKPTICREDPIDLREYHARNQPFPHQPTLDQFFDETQWESYRKLGEVIGRRVFTGPDCFDDWLARLATSRASISAGSPDTSSSPGSRAAFP